MAKRRYEGVGDWLARWDHWLLSSIAIRLQGSVAIRTTVKPVGANEHDVDLVAHVPDLDITVSPPRSRRGSGTVSVTTAITPRCWLRCRVAGALTTPTNSIWTLRPRSRIRNVPGRGAVPDKALKMWKPSNPKGYRAKFDRRAALQPRIRSVFGKAYDSARADSQVEPYPEEKRLKGILRRIVQIAKRHRDMHFIDDGDGLAPLSIIITTLASRAYEYCVNQFEYDHELDLIVARLASDADHAADRQLRGAARLVSLESDHRRRELLREVE